MLDDKANGLRTLGDESSTCRDVFRAFRDDLHEKVNHVLKDNKVGDDSEDVGEVLAEEFNSKLHHSLEHHQWATQAIMPFKSYVSGEKSGSKTKQQVPNG